MKFSRLPEPEPRQDTEERLGSFNERIVDAVEAKKDTRASSAPHPNHPKLRFMNAGEGQGQRAALFDVDPMASLAFCSSAVQFADSAAVLAYTTTEVLADTRGAPDELIMLSEEIMQYSKLLYLVVDPRRSISNGLADGIQEVGWPLIRDSENLLNEVSKILEYYTTRRGSIYRALSRMKAWQSKRNDVLRMLKQVSRLKSTLSLML
ncbi:hypothetical protein LTR37_003188 [Vermiconidia calcicola]|uniref:Uncharacterized protein n=1 Tax=Vermiconidia calcicola TaxID=1690605 RepID=A0ACC3NS50_9PEZI|nr:hypothetical protein LTR37_003188 [Vermiconidia calcicola]